MWSLRAGSKQDSKFSTQFKSKQDSKQGSKFITQFKVKLGTHSVSPSGVPSGSNEVGIKLETHSNNPSGAPSGSNEVRIKLGTRSDNTSGVPSGIPDGVLNWITQVTSLVMIYPVLVKLGSNWSTQ